MLWQHSQKVVENKNLENSFNSLKVISSITFAGLFLLAMPFITISAEAEEKSQFNTPSVYSTNIVATEIEMIEEDTKYINSIREHYHLD